MSILSSLTPSTPALGEKLILPGDPSYDALAARGTWPSTSVPRRWSGPRPRTM